MVGHHGVGHSAGVSGSQILLFIQQLVGVLQLLFVRGVHVLALALQRHSGTFPRGSGHDNLALVSLIPQNVPAAHLGIHQLGVPDDAGDAPQGGDTVQSAISVELAIFLGDVVIVGHLLGVQLHQAILLLQLGEDVLVGEDHVIIADGAIRFRAFRPRLGVLLLPRPNFGQDVHRGFFRQHHFFVRTGIGLGAVGIIGLGLGLCRRAGADDVVDLDARLLREGVDEILTDEIAFGVDRQGGVLAAAGQGQGQQHGEDQ